MLIAISGVTGVGKSFYCNLIEKKFDVERIHTIRTREKRERRS